ncbi:hypothetical protein ACFB49_35160 [Sphingomonas sp. DBB INV C78]|uniref:hypothetical protein n=1 Tax=Sphingomonas sp. DBB INV C78 TaxID=3349434 RepID=UPI0036D2A249
MAYADVVPVPFEMGRVIRRMTESIGRRWATLGLTILLVSVLPGVAYQTWFGASLGQNAKAPFAMFTDGSLAMAWIMLMIVGFVAQIVIMLILLGDQLGEEPSLRDSIAPALGLLLPVVAIKIVVWLSLAIAWMFFLVPALILFTRWFVGMPALVAERGGVLESLGRSRDLTDGSRWRVFGLIALIGILYMVLLGTLFPLAFMAASGTAIVIVVTLVQQIVAGAGAIVWAAALVSTYVELREVKEGAPTNQLAEVFA